MRYLLSLIFGGVAVTEPISQGLKGLLGRISPHEWHHWRARNAFVTISGSDSTNEQELFTNGPFTHGVSILEELAYFRGFIEGLKYR